MCPRTERSQPVASSVPRPANSVRGARLRGRTCRMETKCFAAHRFSPYLKTGAPAFSELHLHVLPTASAALFERTTEVTMEHDLLRTCCACSSAQGIFNVQCYGATGDGHTDDLD